MKMLNDTGTVLQVQSFSLHDGEGIRTVIFLPGCPLRCKWCANPETWTAEPKLAFYHQKCLACGRCKKTCPQGIYPAMEKAADKGCSLCGRCVSACKNKALAILCKQSTVHDITKKIRRDEIFFRHSNGGVTFSGGEPTVQQFFLRAIAEELYNAGIDMWIETCGYFNWEDVHDIFAKFSHVFYDLKCMDSNLHVQLTGAHNRIIVENAIRIHKTGVPMTIRIPCVKGANFTNENIAATAIFVRDNLGGADIELLPYHNYGNEKYTALKMTQYLNQYEPPSSKEISEAEAIINDAGVKTISYK